MTKQCPIGDDQSQLAQLVRDAEEGTPIELTRDGDPVAVLVSIEEFQRLEARTAKVGQPVEADKKEAFTEWYEKFLRSYPIEEYGYEESDFEGLRDRTPGREVDF